MRLQCNGHILNSAAVDTLSDLQPSTRALTANINAKAVIMPCNQRTGVANLVTWCDRCIVLDDTQGGAFPTDQTHVKLENNPPS